MRLMLAGRGIKASASVPVPNRDIGFVAMRQQAVVKVDTFNYLRYGTLVGRVVTLSADAVDAQTSARASAEGGAASAAAGASQGNPAIPTLLYGDHRARQRRGAGRGRTGAPDTGHDGDGGYPDGRAAGGGLPTAASAAVRGRGLREW